MRGLMMLLAGVVLVTPQGEAPRSGAAEPLHVRVLDGRNGQPVKDEQVNLWYDEQEGRPVVLVTDEHGEAQVPPSPAPAVRLLVQPATSVDCRQLKADAAPVAYSLRMVQETGLGGENGCGRVGYRTRPGELVLYVRSRRWYDGLKQ